MAALVILFPAAFVMITELLASKLLAKVGIHRYNTANRGSQTSQPKLFFIYSLPADYKLMWSQSQEDF